MTDDLVRHARAAAQVIAGEDPPSEWLLGAVDRAAYELAYVIKADARIPGRADLRQQITAIRDASKLLDVLLFPFMYGGKTSLLLSDHLLRGDEICLEYESQLHRILEDLRERCGEALNRVPEGGGQGRTLSKMVGTYTASSKVVCGLSVQLIWNEVRGRLPALNSEQAQQACSELWLAAGGKGTKLSGWRIDMKEARDDRCRQVSGILARLLGVQGIHPETPKTISRTRANMLDK